MNICLQDSWRSRISNYIRKMNESSNANLISCWTKIEIYFIYPISSGNLKQFIYSFLANLFFEIRSKHIKCWNRNVNEKAFKLFKCQHIQWMMRAKLWNWMLTFVKCETKEKKRKNTNFKTFSSVAYERVWFRWSLCICVCIKKIPIVNLVSLKPSTYQFGVFFPIYIFISSFFLLLLFWSLMFALCIENIRNGGVSKKTELSQVNKHSADESKI